MRWSKVALLLGVGGLFLILAWNFLPRAARLPHIRLPNGGEFRVLKVTYPPGPSEPREHAIGAAPKAAFWIWHRLPKPLQDRIPYPDTGSANLGSSHPGISIWWAYIAPKTGLPQLGPTDYALTTLDSGEQLGPIWPPPVEEGYRQIFLADPPHHSRKLHFRLSAEGQPVEFELANPAYRN